MKQATLSFYLLTFLCFSAFSQGYFIEIEGGSGFPLAAFRSATVLSGGNVNPGVQLGGAAGISFNGSWSLGVRTMYTRNYMRMDPQVNYASRPLLQTASALIITKFSKPISESLYAEAEAQVGNMWRILSSRERRGRAMPSGLALGFRLGAKYYFSEKAAYQLSINYLDGNINIGDLRLASSQNINLVLFNIGISIEL